MYMPLFNLLLLFIAQFIFVTSHNECGIRSLPQEERINLLNMETELKMKRSLQLPSRQTVTRVPVHWNVIYVTDTDTSQFAPVSRLEAGTAELNRWYNQGGLEFFVASIQYINADNRRDWYVIDVFSSAYSEIKSTFHRGNAKHLNIYLTNVNQYGGYSSFPYEIQYNGIEQDGFFLSHSSFYSTYNDSASNYFGLALAAHECGHWLGLFHTFEGGCSEYNDLVDDTPAVSTPNYFCDTPVDSCPNLPGEDLTTNVMDYGIDFCRQNITAGQIQRVREQFALYRDVPINQSAIPSDPIIAGLPNSGSSTTMALTTNGQEPQLTTSSITSSSFTTSSSAGLTTNPLTTSRSPPGLTTNSLTTFHSSATSSTTSLLTTSRLTTSLQEVTTSTDVHSDATTSVINTSSVSETGITTNTLTTRSLTTSRSFNTTAAMSTSSTDSFEMSTGSSLLSTTLSILLISAIM